MVEDESRALRPQWTRRDIIGVVRLGKGQSNPMKGNAQALGRRSDGAANGTPQGSPLLLHGLTQQMTERVGGKRNK